MIEIEKKFPLSPANENLLTKNAELIRTVKNTDTYFDTEDYKLTTKDWWMRIRNDSFELKIAQKDNLTEKTNIYEEVTDQTKIRELLNLPTGNNLEQDLIDNGYLPFITCITTRRKYKNGDFTIDLDHVDFDSDFTYDLAEIELTIEDPNQCQEASDKIMAFAETHGLQTEKIRGKVIEYLHDKRPNHYKALVQSGVIEDF
ncbi:CYTH domain-containing protein [Patescibacteria group bacterium]|nr:CYTH domain-containing protein [Patescibacteria group bacterium]